MARTGVERLHICVHEAAHYVAIDLLGPGIPRVREIWVGDRGSRPHVRLQRIHSHDFRRRIKNRSTAENFAVALLAGPAAEVLLLGRGCDDFYCGDGSDQMKAIRILDDYACIIGADIEARRRDEGLESLVDRAASTTRVFVLDHRDRIMYVARELYRGGSLDARALEAKRRRDPMFGPADLIQWPFDRGLLTVEDVEDALDSARGPWLSPGQ